MTTPEELWTHALALVAAASDEVQRRRAVSLLYYATFHAVSALLSFQSGGANTHERLLLTLKNARGSQHVRAAGRLDALRKARVRADYDLEVVFPRDAVLSAQHHAEAVRQLLGILAAPANEARNA